MDRKLILFDKEIDRCVNETAGFILLIKTEQHYKDCKKFKQKSVLEGWDINGEFFV